MGKDYFQDLRQGSVVQYTGQADLHGAHVVVSQTCDVVLAKREYLQLAPLIALEGSERRQALKHENPRYARVGQGEDCSFADLARIVSVLKDEVLDVPTVPGYEFATDDDERDFGLAVGRWFGRFAVPDEVHFWLAPLQKLVRSKYDKPASPIGRVLNHVSEIRVESNDWNSPGMQLTIHVIVAAGRLPSLPDEIAEPPDQRRLPTDANSLAEKIDESGPGDDPFYANALWTGLAEALAAKCDPGKAGESEAVSDAVSEVIGEVYSDDEFPLAKVRRSEQLDIDFLSPPVPFGDDS
ncbi:MULTISPECIES: hypothetical protein [unclassified Brevibacterium]|uniref:hypothetical protein n=1 Tax=unclassified Brevibacterium TaxID=2614124 RepID=UPI0010919318|nr:hypothetical protein [Brevibacterium sp. S22]TGD31040.1 hypothetical protein EB835_10560 [Brevibacterium sp. S22]